MRQRTLKPMREYIKGTYGEDDVDHHIITDDGRGPRGERGYEVMSLYIRQYLVWLVKEKRFVLLRDYDEEKMGEGDSVFYDYDDLVEKLLVYEKTSECLQLAAIDKEEMRKSRETNSPPPYVHSPRNPDDLNDLGF
jgi:hypothetical protein